MKLNDYLNEEVGRQRSLAKQIGSYDADLHNWRYGIKPVPPKRAVQIELATNCEVTRKDLRPDDWQEIWIELK